MGEADQATTIGIIDRLSRLEGMLVILQNSIGQSQQQWSSSQQKVEVLEQRLVHLEASRVTREDMKELSNKVDALINRDAQVSGGTGILNWFIKNSAAWVAILISVLAINESVSSKKLPESIPPQHSRQP